MKYIFLYITVLFTTNDLFAQSAIKPTLQARHSKVMNTLLQAQTCNTGIAEKTSNGVTMERVIAQSTRDSFNAYVDSVKLGYSGSRSSQYDYNTMLYPYNYPYSTSPMFNYTGTFTKPQVLFDTFTHWTVDPNTDIYGYYETAYAGYDAASN